jgi:aminoglycoside phosphotransferase (APT) family kinase protein
VTVPGALIASGRDADIFECGRGRVLRRSRRGHSMADEARTMEFARAHGYPVPEVFDVQDDGRELILQRIDGPNMVEAVAARPWQLGRMGRQLAELHLSLHELQAPAWLHPAAFGRGDRLLHMDLHPLNVLLGADGPMVIDWTNALRGAPSIDAALTWVLLASGEAPTGRMISAVTGFGRRVLLRNFLQSFRLEDLRAVIGDVVDWKCADANMSVDEVARMQRLKAANGLRQAN